VFHFELRQFPHVARAFNLSEQELEARLVRPWLAGQPVQYDDRRWSPDRARLTIYEAPQLRTDQLGLGRGWAEVTRSGTNVTEQLLVRARANERSAAGELRDEVLRRARAGALTLDEVTALAPGREAAEQVVLELLREGRLTVSGRR